MHDDYGEEGGRLIGNNKIRSRRISIREEGGSKSEDGNYALRAFQAIGGPSEDDEDDVRNENKDQVDDHPVSTHQTIYYENPTPTSFTRGFATKFSRISYVAS